MLAKDTKKKQKNRGIKNYVCVHHQQQNALNQSLFNCINQTFKS